MASIEAAKQEIECVNEQIAKEEENLRMAKNDLRKLKREARREKYLMKQIRDLESPMHVGLRALQAGIYVRKWFPQQMRQRNVEIKNLQNKISALNRSKDLNEAFIDLQTGDSGVKESAKRAESGDQVVFTKAQLQALLPIINSEAKFVILK